MSVPELYEATFIWPHTGANDVIVTGEFDAWSASHHLTRDPAGTFSGTVKLPWGSRYEYKYIVDGNWIVSDEMPTEYDHSGNQNNVYTAPPRPAEPEPAKAVAAPVSEPAPSSSPDPAQSSGPLTGIISSVTSTMTNAAVAMVEAIAPGTTETPAQTPAADTEASTEGILGTVTDAKQVVVENTSHAVEAAKAAIVESAPEAEPNQHDYAPELPTPQAELSAEAVLPKAAEDIDIKAAPEVPVPVLPLAVEKQDPKLETTIVEGTVTAESAAAVEPSTHTPAPPTANGHTEKALETTVVEGATTSAPEDAVEPSTHTPAAPPPVTEEADSSNGTAVEPSTHTPAGATLQPDEPTVLANGVTPTPSPAANGNGNGTDTPKPESVPLPLPTPAEVPLPATPAPAATNGHEKADEKKTETNGHTKNASEPASAASTPQSTPRKEKLRAFPSLRSHRRASSSVSLHADEHGSAGEGESTTNGKHAHKRRTSFFGKIREKIFH